MRTDTDHLKQNTENARDHMIWCLKQVDRRVETRGEQWGNVEGGKDRMG